MATTDTDWKIDTDIYDISDNINRLQKRYIEDESETTLALGIFGFTSDLEAKKIQTSTIMTGQLGNEMFPTRARLSKNVLTHAIYNNIEGINAVPAHIDVSMCIRTTDFDTYMDSSNEFIIDADCPIMIDEYEFHFDYDILIKRKKVNGKYNYSAQYIMTDENGNRINNRLSNVTIPYLKQPVELNIDNYTYIGFTATIRQYSLIDIDDTMTSDSIIENKSYNFEFENQLADFDVTLVDEKGTKSLTPYFYGMSSGDDEYYCWYLYVNDSMVRITFDSKSYIPGLNSNIKIRAYTTLGESGNFDYLKIDEDSEGFYVDLTSEKYGYNKLTSYIVALSDSTDGEDAKSKEELQKLIPKAAISRGSITTEKDVNNYFNLIDSDQNRLVMQKKVDNQLERVWYGYFLLKDDYMNIIPTNTINLRLATSNNTMIKLADGRFILPAGSIVKYDPESNLGDVIDEVDVPELFSDEYFNDGFYYYMTMYNIALDLDPLYCSYFMSLANENTYFVYNYVNEDSNIQYIANRLHFERDLLIDQDHYKISFKIAQSIRDTSAYNTASLNVVNPDGSVTEETFTTNNIVSILVFYKNGLPYRWAECTFDDDSSNTNDSIYAYTIDLPTDNRLDDNNRLKILDLYEAGSRTLNYGYFDANTKVSLYILAKTVLTSEIDNPRKDLDSIAPGYNDYTVTNIYDVNNGLNFFENYTNVLTSKVTVDEDTTSAYLTYGVPVVGKHYMISEENVKLLLDAVVERKAYIDYCLQLLENSMSINFKFFNTYGPAHTFTKDEEGKHSIGHIDITLDFKLKLKNLTDIYTKPDIVSAIKDYIEDIYDLGGIHIPNLITKITNEFSDRIDYIEFVGYNTFGTDCQHIFLQDLEDPLTVPEFINVRNNYDEDTMTLSPAINIEIVGD